MSCWQDCYLKLTCKLRIITEGIDVTYWEMKTNVTQIRVPSTSPVYFLFIFENQFIKPIRKYGTHHRSHQLN